MWIVIGEDNFIAKALDSNPNIDQTFIQNHAIDKFWHHLGNKNRFIICSYMTGLRNIVKLDI